MCPKNAYLRNLSTYGPRSPTDTQVGKQRFEARSLQVPSQVAV